MDRDLGSLGRGPLSRSGQFSPAQTDPGIIQHLLGNIREVRVPEGVGVPVLGDTHPVQVHVGAPL